MTELSHEARLQDYQDKINRALQCYVTVETLPQGKIFKAMGYSLHAGGKRIRPVLVLEFARICGSRFLATPFACAIEMIHTYSLIHDDLPCMDNDAMRRGRPTNHMVHGEALALLAGDALLTRAFEIAVDAAMEITESCGGDGVKCLGLEAVRALAYAAGAYGMIGGQVIDIEGENRALDLEETTRLQELKTGALIRASAEIGCIVGEATEAQLASARRYADALGLAFQIQDDILNVEGDPKILGKDVGNDEKSGKSTFVKLLGLAECKRRVEELTEQAVEALDAFEDRAFLTWLTRKLNGRKS